MARQIDSPHKVGLWFFCPLRADSADAVFSTDRKEWEMAGKVEHSVPPPGSIFRHSYKGQEYVMTVAKESGTVCYSVSGKKFRSPSAAAVAITGGPTNGWLFWYMDKASADSK